MATKPYPAGRAAVPGQPALPGQSGAWTARWATHGFAAVRDTAAHRTSRPYLAYLGVPLAMIASFLAAPILVPPLIACGWWYTPRDSGWEWLVVAGRGLIGTEWALIGVNILAEYPDHRVQGGVVWSYAALVIGSLAYMGRAGRPRR